VTYGVEVKDETTHRRPLLKSLVGGTLALGAVTATSRVVLSPDGLGARSKAGGALQLSTHGASDIRALDVRLGDELLPQLSANRWGSSRLMTSTHSMVAFTWGARAPRPRIQINSRVDGVWLGWRAVAALQDLPDPDSGEGSGTLGTELVWIGDADGIQVRVSEQRPDDLTMVLLHPARRARDLAVARTWASPRAPAVAQRGSTSMLRTPRPTLQSRADWGADESWRDGSPRYNDTIQQVHVHHTVNSNDYAKEDVPALIRGMYRYHTKNLGWSDIAYNFLVDRFGRTWVGRAGGAARPVRGAHTLGFNATSTGISVIGNFELATPDTTVVEAIAQVAAWKLSKYGRQAGGKVEVVSEGSDKFRAGKRVTLPVVDGHRDTNDTACPGKNLYAALPAIRRRTDALIAAAQLQPMIVTVPSGVAGAPVIGETLSVVPASISPSDAVPSYAWLRNGISIVGATAATYAPVAADLGTQLSVRVTHTRSGYETAVETANASGLVRARSSVVVAAPRRIGRVVIRVAVEPVGVEGPATGAVTVKVNKRKKKDLQLEDGTVTARFVGFSKGRYDVVVKYAGDARLLPARASRTVRVQ
jgi:hypothetical protein